MKKAKVIGMLCVLTTLFLLSGCKKKEELQEITMLEEDFAESGASESEINGDSADGTTSSGQGDNNNEISGNNSVTVHILGAVTNPGVYELPEGSRVVDVLNLAGGFTSDASITWLNQARLLVDGEQIYVPTETETEKLREQGLTGESSMTDQTGDSTGQKSGLVNINQADAEQLMTLPGIGESKAAKIIAYREEVGGFSRIEDLMNIPGIKEGVYNQIKDLITI